MVHGVDDGPGGQVTMVHVPLQLGNLNLASESKTQSLKASNFKADVSGLLPAHQVQFFTTSSAQLQSELQAPTSNRSSPHSKLTFRAARSSSALFCLRPGSRNSLLRFKIQIIHYLPHICTSRRPFIKFESFFGTHPRSLPVLVIE